MCAHTAVLGCSPPGWVTGGLQSQVKATLAFHCKHLHPTGIFEVKIPQLLKLMNYIILYHAVSYKQVGIKTQFLKIALILDLIMKRLIFKS